jgi:intracellular septation protein
MTQPKRKSGMLTMLIDYGPMLAFFLAYRAFRPAGTNSGVGDVLAVTKSTGVFMAASVAALVVSKWRLGRISPMLWLSSGLVLFFGGMTVILHDATWVQIKPTVIYLASGLALLVGLWRGKALLKILLEDAFAGLSDEGWRLLSRNWGWFFLGLAALNEALRHFYNQANGNFDTWLAMKLWLFMPLSFGFTLLHMPMLMKHGLGQDEAGD